MIPILSGNVASALPTGYNVDNAIRFNRADNAFLSKTFSGAGTRTKYTISVWVKRSGLGTTQTIFSAGTGANNYMTITFNGADNRLYWHSYSNDGSNYDYFLYTTRRFRDVSAWLHVVCAFDSTQGTASNRQKMYVNGVQQDAFETDTYSGSYSDYAFNNILHRIGEETGATSRQFDGYMAEFCAIDGLQLAPTDFGEYDEDSPTIWKPKDVSGLTFGTNGFYLNFENSSELGTDVSGNSNTFTENNLDATDQATDTCTNNFCTLNPLAQHPSDSTGAYTQGNCVYTVSDYNPSARGTFGMSAGKWYWECKQSAVQLRAGICTSGFNTYLDTDNTSAFFPNEGGAVHVMNTNTGTSWQRTNNSTSRSVDTFTSAIASTSGSIINFAFDADSGKMWWGVDGVYLNSGDPANGTNPTLTAVNPTTDPYHCFTSINSSSSISASFNFGGCPSFSISSGNTDGNGYGNFEHSVPSGFFSLCTKNLAEYGG